MVQMESEDQSWRLWVFSITRLLLKSVKLSRTDCILFVYHVLGFKLHTCLLVGYEDAEVCTHIVNVFFTFFCFSIEHHHGTSGYFEFSWCFSAASGLYLEALCIKYMCTFGPWWEGLPNGPRLRSVPVETILSAK